MPSRRTVLGNLVGAVLGGTLAIGTAAGSESLGRDASERAMSTPRTPDDTTTVTARIDPAILSKTGIPAPFESPLSDLQRATAVSLDDIDTVEATASIRGQQLSHGHATLRGQFDVEQVVTRLGEHDPSFGRLSRSDTAMASAELNHPGPETTVLVRDDVACTVAVQPSQLVAVADTTNRPQSGLAQLRSEQKRPLARAGASGTPGVLLDGDAAVYATLTDESRDWIRSKLRDASPAVRELLLATRAGGASLSVGRRTGRLRYLLRIDPQQHTDEAVRTLRGELTDDDDIALVDADIEAGRIVADVAVGLEQLWTVHQHLLGETRF